MLHKYDTILHEVRVLFNLTHVEYCVMNTISGLSLSQNWCALSNKELAATQSISAIYVGQICAKLFDVGLIITKPAIGKTSLKKATKIWIDAVELAKKNLKNTTQPQNKVYRLEPPTIEQSMHVPNNFVITTPKQSMLSYKNKKEEDKEEYIQPCLEQAQGIYIFFNDFKKACTDYFDAKCAVRNTKKSDSLEMCFIHLVNNALAGSDIGRFDAKTIKAYNPDESEINAVKGEIKRFLGGLEFYKLEKSRFEQGSTGFYAPKLIKSILIKNEYSKLVSEKPVEVTPKNTDWRVAFLPKLQKISPTLDERDLDKLIGSSRAILGMIIHRLNTTLTRTSIGEFVKNNPDLDCHKLSQKDIKAAFKTWLDTAEAGRAFVLYAKEKEPLFLQELAAQSK